MKIISLFICLLIPLWAWGVERPHLISGFDDVLRQADNTSLINVSIKIFEPDKTYAGMPELYRLLTKHEKKKIKFSLVSAISKIFDSRINRFLKKEQYPVHERHLRSWLTQWSIDKFKMDKVEEILATRKNQDFIVVFDNSEASVQLTRKLQGKYTQRLKALYLRQVVKKKVPSGATPFLTAFDIAVHEFQAGRLQADEVKNVGLAILRENNREKVLPSYGFCPPTYEPCRGFKPSFLDICSKVQNHIELMCKKG